jgi:peptidoglycan LD-endopeptidase CwlK
MRRVFSRWVGELKYFQKDGGMKFYFGSRSQSKLDTVVPTLRRVAMRALSYGIIDMAVTEGRRDKKTQNLFYASGKSKVCWPDSKHNVLNPNDPAHAIDIVPYVNGSPSWRMSHCCIMAGLILAAAAEEGVTLRWGGNWDMDAEPITDQDFQDLVHFEEV